MTVKWTEEMVSTIHEMRNDKKPFADIADRLGVTIGTLNRWCDKNGFPTHHVRSRGPRPAHSILNEIPEFINRSVHYNGRFVVAQLSLPLNLPKFDVVNLSKSTYSLTLTP